MINCFEIVKKLYSKIFFNKNKEFVETKIYLNSCVFVGQVSPIPRRPPVCYITFSTSNFSTRQILFRIIRNTLCHRKKGNTYVILQPYGTVCIVTDFPDLFGRVESEFAESVLKVYVFVAPQQQSWTRFSKLTNVISETHRCDRTLSRSTLISIFFSISRDVSTRNN